MSFPLLPSGTAMLVRKFVDGDLTVAGELVRRASSTSLPDVIAELRLAGRLTPASFDAVADAFEAAREASELAALDEQLTGA